MVTGAFGYTGKYLTRKLLASGFRVKNLTGHPHRPNEFGEHVSSVPWNFDRPDQLIFDLQGVDVLYNTYWVRFPQGGQTFGKAVHNSKVLFQAAKRAGVRRNLRFDIDAGPPGGRYHSDVGRDQGIDEQTAGLGSTRLRNDQSSGVDSREQKNGRSSLCL